MNIDSLAQALFGSKRAETQEVSTDGTTRTYTGVALTDSEDGTVVIDLGGDVTLPDDLYDEDGNVVAEWDGVGVEMPTSPQVSAGDDVIVTLMGGSATKTPMVTSSAGSGDRLRALVNAAQTVANAAQAVAEAVNQHFFADTNGIHVTEVTQEEWDENHTGANVLINSIGQLFRDGLNNLLTLTTENGARALTIWDGLGNAAANVRAMFGEVITLGKADESHLEMDYHSLQMLDKEGRAYFHISDLRNADGWATIEQKFSSNGGSTFNLSFITYPDRIISVTVSGVETTAYSLNMSNHRTITFDSPPTGAIVVTYETNDPDTKAYTIGIRADGGLVAPYSVAAGYLVTAGGFYSHAEGFATTANGRCGHAEGFGAFALGDYAHAGGQSTVASGDGSFVHGVGCTSYCEFETVFGRYNELNVFSRYAFVIGNGTDNDHRSNAHTVDWDGNAWYAGDVTASGNVKGATINDLPYPAPVGTYTGTNTTATASANGWQLTWFNTVVNEVGTPRTYDYTFSNGTLTATRDCKLEISGVMNWKDSVAGLRGFGIFEGTTAGSGTEHSAFQQFPSAFTDRKSVVFPPKVFALSSGDSLAFGRYQQAGAVYQNGTNYSWVTIRVVG